MKKYILILIALVSFSLSAKAQNKMASFDLQYVLPQIPEYKQAQNSMETYANQVEDEIKSRQSEYETKQATYNEKAETYSPAMRASKERELQTLQQQFQRFQQTVQQEAQNKEASLMAPIYEKVEKALKEVASAGSYNFVIRTESLYSRVKANDISDKVLIKLGITPKK